MKQKDRNHNLMSSNRIRSGASNREAVLQKMCGFIRQQPLLGFDLASARSLALQIEKYAYESSTSDVGSGTFK